MRHLYVITIELDEDSEYFTEMTVLQAKRMEKVLEKSGYNFNIEQIKKAEGFNSFADLMRDFKDFEGRVLGEDGDEEGSED